MPENTEIHENKPEYTVEYILAQMEKIRSDTSHIESALAELAKVKSNGPGDVGTQGLAMALGDIVKCRETTNQQMLRLYMTMFEKLTGGKTE